METTDYGSAIIGGKTGVLRKKLRELKDTGWNNGFRMPGNTWENEAHNNVLTASVAVVRIVSVF